MSQLSEPGTVREDLAVISIRCSCGAVFYRKGTQEDDDLGSSFIVGVEAFIQAHKKCAKYSTQN